MNKPPAAGGTASRIGLLESYSFSGERATLGIPSLIAAAKRLEDLALAGIILSAAAEHDEFGTGSCVHVSMQRCAFPAAP